MPCVISGIIAAFAILFAPPSDAPAARGTSAPLPGVSSSAPVDLNFNELVISDENATLKPSAKALSLEGKRVRLTGFVAQLEDAPRGGFYLCPLPVRGDESGAGIGDLPAHTIVVRLPYAPNLPVPPQKGRVIVTGVFHVGAVVPADDFVGSFHVMADRPAPAESVKTGKSAKTTKQPTTRKSAARRGR